MFLLTQTGDSNSMVMNGTNIHRSENVDRPLGLGVRTPGAVLYAATDQQ